MDYKEKADELAHWCTGGCISIHPDAIPSWTLAFEKALTEAFAAGLADALTRELAARAIDPNSWKNLCQENAMLRNDMSYAQERIKSLESELAAMTKNFLEGA